MALNDYACASPVSVAPDTVIVLDSNGHIPVVFQSVEGNMTFRAPGLLELITPRRSTFYASWQRQLDTLATFSADSVSIGDRVRLPVNTRVPISTAGIRDPIIGIPVSSGTAFMNAVGGFVVMADGENGTQLVLNPSNPSAHAFDNALSYVEMIGTTTSFPLRMQVFCAIDQVLSSRVSALVGQISLLTDITYIPHGILHPLYDEFRLLGTLVNNGYGYILINDGGLDSFPTITLTINNAVLALYPRDYLVPLSSGEAQPGMTCYKVMLRGHSDQIIRIGKHISGKFTIHIDSANNRIGFGESINDDNQIIS